MPIFISKQSFHRVLDEFWTIFDVFDSLDTKLLFPSYVLRETVTLRMINDIEVIMTKFRAC